MSAHTRQKGVRLLAEGRVKPEDDGTFTVRGDSDTYKVEFTCGCKAHGHCSHIDAAMQWMTASPVERALMEEIRQLRSGEAR